MKLKYGFVVREVGGRSVAVAIGARGADTPSMITLNDSGKVIWQALSRETSVDEIVDLLTAEFDVSREVAEIDVLKFLDTLRSGGLLIE